MTNDALSLRPILWTLYEAACHLTGQEPTTDNEKARSQVLGTNAKSNAGQVYRAFKDAAFAREPRIIPVARAWVGNFRIAPIDAVALARSWGLTVPSACIAVATANPAPSGHAGRELTVVIQGREALPVRAIPYITVGMIGPDEVAQTLAGKTDRVQAQFGDASAYYDGCGSPVPMLPKEWDAVVRRLDAFKAELRAQYPSKDYDARRGSLWGERAALLLPAGVFVWRDEFERNYASPDRPSYTAKRKGERDLILAPMLADDVRAHILEGFAVDDVVPQRGDADLAAVGPPPVSTPKANDDGASPTCAVFREMLGLRPDEVTIEFAAGESGGAVLNILARGQRKRVTTQEFGLFDRRRADLNKQGGLLLGMAGGRKPKIATNKDSKRISRLRDVFKKHLGISGDPFAPYTDNRGYSPRFIVLDKRDAAKERAEREANRKTDPLDSPEVMARVDRQQAEEHQRGERDDLEDDPAAKWLSKHDLSR